MGLPAAIDAAAKKLEPKSRKAFLRDYKRRRKSLVVAYVAWLLLGWHYLYMGKASMQIAFWISLGGFLVWYAIDFFRLPGMIARMNEDTARQLVAQYHMMSK